MENDKKTFSIKDYVLFKLDRTLAILGLIGIGAACLFTKETPEASVKIITAVVTALSMYLGIRLGNK